MNLKTQVLSSAERALLEEAIELMALAINYISIALPVLVIFTMASWYFDWHWMVKSTSTLISVVLSTVFVACFIHTDSARMDLKVNTKVIVNFRLLEKYAEGYVTPQHNRMNSLKVKMRIDVSEEEIEKALEYKKSVKHKTIPLSDRFEKVLNYSYHVSVHNIANGEDEEFSVPIELYIEVQNGQDIYISYAVNSRMVFTME